MKAAPADATGLAPHRSGFANDRRRFHRWADWSPYEKLDAGLKRSFSGAERGVGAAYACAGRKAGSGRMEITACKPPARIVVRLDFIKPISARNTAEFTFERVGSGTKVTWAAYGRTTFLTKVMGLFFSMDKLLGPQFEAGFAGLKRVAERVTEAA